MNKNLPYVGVFPRKEGENRISPPRAYLMKTSQKPKIRPETGEYHVEDLCW